MDFYTFSLILGGSGLGVMALSGLSHQGHDAHGGHHGHADAHGGGHHVGGHHGAHHAGAHHGGHHAGAHNGGVPAHHGDSHHGESHGAHTASHAGASRVLWSLISPRVMFSVLVGLGATGSLARGVLGGPLLLAAALAGGILFERLLVSPLWNFAFRFASAPALSLESVIADEVEAVTSFDKNGQGMVAVDLDGQVVQLLGTLRTEDRSAGVRVRRGDRLRVEDVDGARNRCTVSFLRP
ncbi:MAG: hypothetical protein WKG32_13485 [Gemmatimonadaceae bacterium]